jgi:hypothetical protein
VFFVAVVVVNSSRSLVRAPCDWFQVESLLFAEKSTESLPPAHSVVESYK